MEDGGVDYRESAAQDGPNGHFPPLLASSVFKHDVTQIESQTMWHGLMNLVNTTLF